MGKYDDLFDEEPQTLPRVVEPAAPRAIDAGPEARRAAAGRPPEGGRVDPSPSFEMQYGTQPKSALQQAFPKPRVEPMEHDPMAQAVVAGTVLGPLGRMIAPQGAGVGAGLGRTAIGAAEGAAVSKSMGGTFKEGAAFGAAAPFMRTTLGLIGEGAVRARQAGRAFQDIGRQATQTQRADLVRLGKETVSDVANEIGYKAAPQKSAAVKAGLDRYGGEIGKGYQQLDAAGTARPLGSVMETMNQLREKLGRTTEGEKMGNVVYSKMRALWELHGGDKGAMVPVSVLNREIGDLEAIGFSGKSASGLSETARATVAREMAGALNSEMDLAMKQARGNPQLAPVVQQIEQLNPRYQALKVLEKVAKRQDANAPFQPRGVEKVVGDAPRTLGRVAGAVADAGPRAFDAAAVAVYDRAPMVSRAVDRLGEVADRAAQVAPAAVPAQRQVDKRSIPVIRAIRDNDPGVLQRMEDALFAP